MSVVSLLRRRLPIINNRLLLSFSFPLILLFCVPDARATADDNDLKQGAEKFVSLVEARNPTLLLEQFSEQGTSFVSGTYALPKASYSPVEIREDFKRKTGVYCVFFDTACVLEADAKERARQKARPGRTPPKAVIDLLASAKERRFVTDARSGVNGLVMLLLSSRTADTARLGEDALNFYFRHEGGEWKLRNIEF